MIPLRWVVLFLLQMQEICCHLTVTPMPGDCQAVVGCRAGAGFYVRARYAHSFAGNYTYKVSMKIPKLQSATIRPQFIPGWALSFNPDANPNERWIHYTAYPGLEVYNQWVGIFQLNVNFRCGTSTSPFEFDDSLIVPMGTSSSGKTFFGALFPTRQYLCEMINGKCVPNGRYNEWAGFNNAAYNSLDCGNAAEANPGSCDRKCRGSTMPCVSFTPNSTATCGNVTIKSGIAGKMDADGEGGDFAPASLTRE
jgi:hypothetical protein